MERLKLARPIFPTENFKIQEGTKYLDIHHPKWVLIWLTWSADGLEEFGEDYMGYTPSWFSENDEANEMLEGSLDFERYRHVEFGLREGIAPHQPFLAKIQRPYWYSYRTEYGTEYDVEYSGSIVKIDHWTPSRIARAWWPYSEKLTIKGRQLVKDPKDVDQRRGSMVTRQRFEIHPKGSSSVYSWPKP